TVDLLQHFGVKVDMRLSTGARSSRGCSRKRRKIGADGRSRGGFSRFSEPMCTAVVRYWPKAAELGGASSGGYLGYTGRAANVVATAAHDPQRTWGGFSDHPAVH